MSFPLKTRGGRILGRAGTVAGIFAALFTSATAHAQREKSGYVDPGTCASCHQEISESYRRTGMGRSFYRPAPANAVEDYTKNNTYYHQPSNSYFQMLQRDGAYYQRRYQLDSAGRQINVMEKRIDFILGSGNHSRAYLHRTERNKLVELPLAWYSEKGGYWAMNPGYDRPNHDGFRREITYDCIFCHNAYPEIPEGNDHAFAEALHTGAMPEGIDCQRCHGPGARHIATVKQAGANQAGLKLTAIRNSIVNPARLGVDRQMEVCMQCHLETTSFPLPNAIQRYERGTFSFRPGEPLADYILNFDHAPGKGRDDKFEIVNSAYRLRKSECFLQSKGQMTCTTCHNPHEVPHADAATRHYTAVCRQCHAAAFNTLVATGRHTSEENCVACHMPKRRTEDAVHVVMTDHYIQRRKPAGDPLAEIPERHETTADAYRGEVVPYYPNPLPHTPENDLYMGIAQVIQGSNLALGIAQLTDAIERYRPQRPEYYLELAEAWLNNGQIVKAVPFYEEAVRRNPTFLYGLRKLGIALRRSGDLPESLEVLKRAIKLAPESAITWHELGQTYRSQGAQADAIAALQKAISLDPDLSEAHNNLGALYANAGEQPEAESAFREAIRIQPDYADAHYNYAMLLGRERQFENAQQELETALRYNPQLADAHEVLGDLLMAKGQTQNAIQHYGEAVHIRPESGHAHLSLGLALAATGDVNGALPHLQRAAADQDPAVRDEAIQTLRQLKK
jgi:predicted CXXCH cytochrome family protein